MEKKTSPRTVSLKYKISQWLSKLLPYCMLVVAIVLALLTWHDFVIPSSADRLFYTLSPSNQPWVILTFTIALLLLCAAAMRLIQLTREHAYLLQQMKHEHDREIAQHLKAEEIKKKLEMALLEGQKLQAIGTLAGGIAHDFNNILYAINGYVEMAREDVPENSLVFKNLGRVLEASQRGQELVARILDFGRRNQRYEQKPFQLKTIIEEVLALLRPTVPASVRIHLNELAGQCLVLGNQTQLHQVIVNIVNNAVDAMEGEGEITISINRVLANDAYLKQFPKTLDQNYCKIDISDTGHGMDQATLKRIFEPFYTTKEVGKGTGLGLATVHGIIAQHNGEVTVTSQLGMGTTFTLLLPEYHPVPTEMEKAYGDYSFSGR